MNEIPQLQLSSQVLQEFRDAACSLEPVGGLTHTFYRYPARFSPLFVRMAILAFTQPSDIVMDPFMGGATTIVEASALGRRAVGLDISALSVFLAKAKAIPISERDLAAVGDWAKRATERDMNLHRPSIRATEWEELGYQRNIQGPQTWPMRKILELGVNSADRLKNKPRKIFARAVLLRTAQWALDCRSDIPSATQFREQLLHYVDEMIDGARAYRAAVEESNESYSLRQSRLLLLQRSAEGIDQCRRIQRFGVPRLVLTSPPYPGVHVMYHRWQVLGRKETPAPFWIANALDGNGLSYYTFGDRHNPGLKTYFEKARANFKSIKRLADEKTIFVQMVAFSDPSWQLPAYLKTMSSVGLSEIRLQQLATAPDGRLWRLVPNRKWYASKRGQQGAAREVVLLHKVTN